MTSVSSSFDVVRQYYSDKHMRPDVRAAYFIKKFKKNS